MNYADSRPLRYDIQLAKLRGIDITRGGWRKDLKRQPPTEEEQAAARAAVVKRDGAVRLRRITRSIPEGHCPFSLHPECEISGELYFRLRSAGIDAKLEVSVPSEFHPSGLMRIDVGVFAEGKLIHAIECKAQGVGLGENTQQAKAYKALRERFGVAIHFANRVQHIEMIVQACGAQPSGN